MGSLHKAFAEKHCWTMKGSLLASTLLVGLWSIIIASSGESSNGGELKNIENNADVLSRTIREAERNGKKLKAEKGKKGKAKKKRTEKKQSKNRRPQRVKGKGNQGKEKKQRK